MPEPCTCAAPMTVEVCRAVGIPIAHKSDCPAIADDEAARFNAAARETHQEAAALNSNQLEQSVASALGGTITSTTE